MVIVTVEVRRPCRGVVRDAGNPVSGHPPVARAEVIGVFWSLPSVAATKPSPALLTLACEQRFAVVGLTPSPEVNEATASDPRRCYPLVNSPMPAVDP